MTFFDRKSALRGLLDQPLHIPAGHERQDHIGLAVLLAHIEDTDDIGMIPQLAHGLGFPADALAGGLIQLLGLDQSKGHVPVQHRIMGQDRPSSFPLHPGTS